MLRTFLLYLSKAAWAQRLVTGWRFAWRAASRFVAGSSVREAMAVVQKLNDRGINVTLDHLGENTTTRQEARKATEDILTLLDAIQRASLRAGVSVKLTQIGLALDPELCAQNLEQILTRARQHHSFVRVDMEDSPYTEQTIQLYRQMYTKGYENTGLVIQAYLYRSEQDLCQLSAAGARIRLVKGAYDEPPVWAFPKKRDVDDNFDRLTQVLIEAAQAAGSPSVSADGRLPPQAAIATHDPRRIDFSQAHARKVGLPKIALEFQMLYGIRRDLQELCLHEGYPVRVYVPYGTHWYPYFMRRLAERPANVWFFLSNFFRK
jgi:proline dehydrogenase